MYAGKLNNRSNRKRIVDRTADCFIILLGCTILAFVLRGPHGLLHLQELDQEVAGLRTKLREVESEIITTSNDIYAFEENDIIAEKMARETLGLSRPGDIVYIFNRSARKN